MAAPRCCCSAVPYAPVPDGQGNGLGGESIVSPATRDGRIVAIDVLRGLAILWVITFHLAADMSVPGATVLYPEVRDHLAAGAPIALLRSLAQLIFQLGYQGVPLFMMLSGASLTLSSYRRPEPSLLKGYLSRGMKLLRPYWAATFLTVATIAVIALLQLLLHGGSYHEQWSAVTLQKTVPVGVTLDDVLYTLSVFGWLFREKGVTFPVGSLWFVQMLLMYYAVFPFALRLLNRIGPWPFAALAVVVTIAARAGMIFIAPSWIEPLYQYRFLFSFGLFRSSEFFIGMSLGYLLVHRREQIAEWVRSPFDIAGIVLLGLLLQLAGGELGPKTRILTVLSDPLIQVALVLFIAPLLFKAPGRFEASRFAAAAAFVGTIAYAELIVNDQIRYFASFLRKEELPAVLWWLFLIFVYMPVGTLLAYPLARALGLLPNRARASAPPASETAAPVELQPAGGG